MLFHTLVLAVSYIGTCGFVPWYMWFQCSYISTCCFIHWYMLFHTLVHAVSYIGTCCFIHWYMRFHTLVRTCGFIHWYMRFHTLVHAACVSYIRSARNILYFSVYYNCIHVCILIGFLI